MEREEQAYLTVAEANCRYMAPARYDDEIVVETELTRLKNRIIEFSYKIKTGSTLLAQGRTVHVVIGPDGRPRQMPERYFELLRAHSQG
jgi:acyl-CoA thioester hydrolase